MERFTKVETQRVMNRVRETLAELGVEMDLNIEIGGVSYGNDISGKISISRNVETEFGIIKMDQKAIEFQSRARLMGLRKEILGEPIKTPRGIYVITGYNSRAKKYPLEYTNKGSRFKTSVSSFMNIIREYRPEYVV